MPLSPQDREEIVDIIKQELLIATSSRYIIEKLMKFNDGRNIQLGLTTGTRVGTSTSQLLGFYNATPVNQPATISDPSGQANDLDSEARAGVNTLIDRLQELGLIA